MVEKRSEIINQFTKNNIICWGTPKKIAESILEESKQGSGQSIPKWVQVPEDRFSFIKQRSDHHNRQYKIYTKRCRWFSK